MAYYDSLIAAWNGVTQPPSGTTGSPLLPTDTTSQKLAKVNEWTVTGEIPDTIYITGNEVLNCINYAEFEVLSGIDQANILNMLAVQGPLLGGRANTALILVGMLIDKFPAGGQTIQALTALEKSITESWCQTNNYPYLDSKTGNLSMADVTNAGLV